jgi:hypothetical protein
MRALIAASAVFLTVTAPAHAIEQGDPAIGGYYFYAALDRKCPLPDAERAAALDKYKVHFIAHMRPMAQSYGAEGAKALQMLDDLERNGPPEDELARYDALFAKISREQLIQLCAEVPKRIEDRIALENRLREAMRQPPRR